MQITDRSKDVIKSGGEWISSIDVENEATACPGVRPPGFLGACYGLLPVTPRAKAYVQRLCMLGMQISLLEQARVSRFFLPHFILTAQT